MRIVLVTQRFTECEAYPEVRECLDRRWGTFFSALGVLPVPVCSALDIGAYLDELEPAGVVLTGGNDLSSVGGGALSEARDAFEANVVSGARARRLPLLGVCRGMQFLAARAGMGIEACEGHIGREHRLVAAAASRYAALAAQTTANSFHGFAVKTRPLDELRVVLRSDDGGVEAIEHPSEPVVGIMWHPERYPSPRPIDLELFRQVLLA